MWEGGAVGNEIRSERLPAIIVEEKSGNMRCAQVGEIVPCE
jgi:hypothetical protein